MKYSRILIILFTLLSYYQILFSQSKRTNIWHFGNKAGIDFNTSPPTALNSSQMNTSEGCSSISDKNGNLLFYTDGVSVWDSTHNFMMNGTGLLGDGSSTQSSIIVRQPLSESIYYIFTTSNAEIDGVEGVRYSQIDLNLNGGKGAITTIKNVQLVNPCTEKLAAVRHANGQDVWVIAHRALTAEFYTYKVTSLGVDEVPIIKTIGLVAEGRTSAFIPPLSYPGHLKVSPDGSKLGVSFMVAGVQLLDFNTSTGEISNVVDLDSISYGLEFSPSSNYLYLGSNTGNILQYDLTSADINASVQVVGTTTTTIGALQLAPDSNIYIASANANSLSVINEPDSLGLLSNFVSNDFALLAGTNSRFGLPQFNASYFGPFEASFSFDNLCINEITTFNNTISSFDSLFWNFGDPSSGASNTSNLADPTHTYNTTGDYTVTLIAFNGSISDTSIQTITILPLDFDNTASFGYSESIYCVTESDPFPITSGVSGGFFSSDNNGVIDSISGQIDIDSSGIGTYLFRYTSNGLCPNTLTETIQIDSCLEIDITVPNVFSPNEDNINDIFSVGDISTADLFDMKIFNRWGILIYETDAINGSWNGYTYEGRKAPDGTYFYIITVGVTGQNKEYKGTVTLLR